MELADYSVLAKSTFNDVYEPAEDTFILVDALEKDLDLIKGIRPIICLEIGSGSGVVITSLGKVLGPAFYLTTDLNPIAASATRVTSRYNNVPVDTVTTDLAEAFESRLQNSIDLIICNPPYAVTPNTEVGGDNLQKATSGGEQGRQVMDRIIPLAVKLLSPNGLFYLVCIKQNDVEDIAKRFAAQSLEMTIVLERRCAIEYLYVLRFSYKQSTS